MRKIVPSSRFDRDLTRALRRGKDARKLSAIIGRLQVGKELEKRHKAHPLVGKWQSYMECHVEADWLLIYQLTKDELRLARIGTHSDLF